MTFVPPFLVFLLGAPLILPLKGRARQGAMVGIAGLGLALVLLLEEGTGWTVPFMEYRLTLLHADPLSLFTGYIFAIITFLAVIYAAAFARPWLHTYALLYAGTSLGAVFAGDFVTLLVFWELMAITSTLLIWEARGDAVAAGLRYLLFHVLGGALLAGGVALHVLETGSVEVGAIAGFWPSLLVALGAGVNVGFIPLHTWLPDAYPRAHIAGSVFLSVYTTKAAVYLLARTSPDMEAVAVMGGVMAVYGVAQALLQNNMRRLLSYHIVSQVGYMVAGVGLGAAAGINGGMAHVFNHILYKALLFMTLGAVIYATGRQTVDRLGGLARKMPLTAITFWIAALSISGVPGFNGYVSKGMVIATAEEELPLVWILLEVASAGTLLSFLKLGYFTFHRRPAEEIDARDPPLPMQAAQVGAAALCVLIGVYPAILFGILPEPNAFNPWTLEHLRDAGIVLGIAALIFYAIGRRVLAPHETRVPDADAAYASAGRGLLAASRGLARGVGEFSDAFVAAVLRVGRGVRAIQTGDLNWNNLGVFLGLAILLLWLLWGVV